MIIHAITSFLQTSLVFTIICVVVYIIALLIEFWG